MTSRECMTEWRSDGGVNFEALVGGRQRCKADDCRYAIARAEPGSGKIAVFEQGDAANVDG